MASVLKSDSVLWLKHVSGDTGLVQVLTELAQSTPVTLLVDGNEIAFEKMQNAGGRMDGSRTPGYRPVGTPARRVWANIPTGSRVPLALVGSAPAARNPAPTDVALEPSALAPRHRGEGRALSTEARPRRVPAWRPDGRRTIAAGADLAWWGGSARDANSRTETIVWAPLGSGELLTLQRLSLESARVRDAGPTVPNADPHGVLFLKQIDVLLMREPEAYVVLSLDAPLQALERGLPARQKVPVAGTLACRASDNAIQAAKRGRRFGAAVNIQPGAPLFPRIRRIVDALLSRGFVLLGAPGWENARLLLVESFPGEAIFFLGNAGSYGTDAVDAVQAYKRRGNGHVAPLATMEQDVRRVLMPFRAHCGIAPEFVDAWVDTTVASLRADPLITTSAGSAVYGKALDDAVESVIAFLVAVSVAGGSAHVFADTPGDGHVAGCGLPSAAFGPEPEL